MIESKDPSTEWRSVGRGIRRRFWGTTKCGKVVHLFELSLSTGPRITLSEYGTILRSWFTPDRNGEFTDIVLGFDHLGEYEEHSPYFGCMVGRYANRIAGGCFEMDGQVVQLECNNSPGGVPCHLHGGANGFDRRVWAAQTTGGEEPAITFTRRSHAGEENYPGNLEVRVTFQLGSSGALRITTTAHTDGATPYSLAHHGYFNLAGEGVTDDHELQIWADAYLPVTSGMIPTGDIATVAGTPFDLRKPVRLADAWAQNHPNLELAGGFDHNFVLRGPGRAALLVHQASGRTLEVTTDLPGLQFYGGQMLSVPVAGKRGKPILPFGGLCLEAQQFPDAPNQAHFPNSILRPGKTYSSITEYRPGVLATDN